MDDQAEGAFFSAPDTPYPLNRQLFKAPVTDAKALLEPASLAAPSSSLPSDSMISELPLHPNPLSTFATKGGLFPAAFKTPTTMSNFPAGTLHVQQEPSISFSPPRCSATQGSRKTKRATQEEWDQHKVTICHLYLDEDKTLAEVRDIMQQQHGLHATTKMYKYRFKKWGLQKNLKEGEVQIIARAKAMRDAAGKSTEILRRGRKVGFARVVRHLERKGKVHLLQQVSSVGDLGPIPDLEKSGVRIVTPPPQLQAPEEFRDPESMLFMIRNWASGNFESGTWIIPKQGSTTSIARQTGENYLYIFRELFHLGRRLLRSSGKSQEGSQVLNLAFEKLRGALKDEQPTTLISLISIVLESLFQSDQELQICALLWSYLHQLAPLALGSNHPLTEVLGPLGKAIFYRKNNEQLKLIAKFTVEHVGRYLGLENFRMFGVHLSCIRIEMNLAGDFHHGSEIFERGARLLLSRADKSPATSDLANRIRREIAWGLHQRGSDIEAKELLLEIINSPAITARTSVESLSLLAQVEQSLSNQEECAFAFLDAVHVCISVWKDIRDIAGIDSHLLNLMVSASEAFEEGGDEQTVQLIYKLRGLQLEKMELEQGMNYLKRKLEARERSVWWNEIQKIVNKIEERLSHITVSVQGGTRFR